MIRALRTAASGMFAQELHVDTIANNLANVNTTGFKRSEVEFQDLLYQTLQMAGQLNQQGVNVPVQIEVGHGTRPIATEKIFSQGDTVATDNPLDLAINGDGFFQILMPDGSIAYTRDGSFKVSADGRIVTSEGYLLQPDLVLPPDATEISVSRQGVVVVKTASSPEPEELGQIELARFVNPAGLSSIGGNLYVATAASGEPIVGVPGEEAMGTLLQGHLELSNVEVVKEMIDLIVAQRAYEINSKAIRSADEMLSMANNLRR